MIVEYSTFKFGILQLRKLGFKQNLVLMKQKCYIVGYIEPNALNIEDNDNHPLWT